MKKGILFFSFMMVFSILIADVIWCAEDNKPAKTKTQESQTQARPILPPVVYPASFGVSPTPSPHIASPQINPQVINTSQDVSSNVSQPVMSHISTAPAAVIMPTVSFSTAVAPQPIIGNTAGRVMSISDEKDGFYWLEINDDVFNEIVKVKISKNIPIFKQGIRTSFEEIKTGSALNIIFNEHNGEDIASFVSVLTEEEVKLMLDENEGGLVVTPVNTTNR